MSARGRAALLLIDLQQGLLDADPPLHDGEGLVRRLSRLAEVIRDRGDLVVVVQDDHGPGLWTPEVGAARNRGLPLRVVATDALVEELQAGRAS